MRTDNKGTPDFYAEVASELDAGSLDNGLWARVFAESGGARDAAKAQYIKLRTENLQAEWEAARLAERERLYHAKRSYWVPYAWVGIFFYISAMLAAPFRPSWAFGLFSFGTVLLGFSLYRVQTWDASKVDKPTPPETAK